MYGFVRSLRSLDVAMGLLLLSGLTMSPAMASTITYNFTGDVTLSNPPPSPINGPTISGFITVDQTDINTNSDNIGTYAVQSFKIISNDVSPPIPLIEGTSGVVNIVREAGIGGPSGSLNVSLNGVDLGGLPSLFDIQLFGSGDIFASDALPNPAPSLSSFVFNQFRSIDSGTPVQDYGVLTSLTAVPLPAAMLLFGAGLISLVGLGTGGLRNLRGPRT